MTETTERESKSIANEGMMTLLEHLAELRKRIIWSLVGFVLSFVLCYHFSDAIYRFLAAPLAAVMSSEGQAPRLIYTALYEAFFTYVRVAAFGAAFLSFPIVATQLWIFIAPGLYKREKRAFLPFLIATPVLFVMGAALAYYGVFPLAWKFFLSFQQPNSGQELSITLEARVSEYLSLVMKMILGFGICFELPVVLTLLVRVGILTIEQLKSLRRYAYVGAFVIAAIIAPPDALTMVCLAIPLMGLYEISILAARLVRPKYDAQEDDSEDEDLEPPQETPKQIKAH